MMKELMIAAVAAISLVSLAAAQHHRNRHGGYRDRYNVYDRDDRAAAYNTNYQDPYASNLVPSGPAKGEAGLPGLPGLQGPPGEPGVCECPEAVNPCARQGSVHMFDYYHDMAGSNIGVGSLAYISDTSDMWLNTQMGWKKIGWIQ